MSARSAEPASCACACPRVRSRPLGGIAGSTIRGSAVRRAYAPVATRPRSQASTFRSRRRASARLLRRTSLRWRAWIAPPPVSAGASFGTCLMPAWARQPRHSLEPSMITAIRRRVCEPWCSRSRARAAERSSRGLHARPPVISRRCRRPDPKRPAGFRTWTAGVGCWDPLCPEQGLRKQLHPHDFMSSSGTALCALFKPCIYLSTRPYDWPKAP